MFSFFGLLQDNKNQFSFSLAMPLFVRYHFIISYVVTVELESKIKHTFFPLYSILYYIIYVNDF